MKITFIAITKVAKSGKYKIAIFNPLDIKGDLIAESNFDLFFQENKEFDLISSAKGLEKISYLAELTDTVEFDFQAGYFSVYKVSEERRNYLLEYCQKYC